MRILLKKRKYSLVWALLLACLVGTSQAMAKDRYEVFKDKVPAGARISVPDAVRERRQFGEEHALHLCATFGDTYPYFRIVYSYP